MSLSQLAHLKSIHVSISFPYSSFGAHVPPTQFMEAITDTVVSVYVPKLARDQSSAALYGHGTLSLFCIQQNLDYSCSQCDFNYSRTFSKFAFVCDATNIRLRCSFQSIFFFILRGQRKKCITKWFPL